ELDISNKVLEGNLRVKGSAKDELDFSHNQISGSQKIMGGVARKINYSYNNLSGFFYDSSSLIYLDVSNNNLTELDMLSNKNLLSLNCSNNPLLNKLLLPRSFDPDSLDSFDCRGTNLNQVNASFLVFDCQNGTVYSKFASPTISTSPTEIFSLPSSNFKPELIVVPITATVGVVLVGGGITYYLIARKKRERIRKQISQAVEESGQEGNSKLADIVELL
ncbi:6050_t:CDS:2, partial [Funneliformis geosporum]